MGLQTWAIRHDSSPSPAWSFEPPPADQLQALFDDLEVESLLGQGGMGAVYRVQQKRLGRPAALKVLPPEAAARAGFKERFEREARTLAQLNHPNIVTIYDFGKEGDYYFLLMEFVDGVTLRHTLDVGELSPAEALSIVPQVCEALQAAHDSGIVHRDIKPENILLDRKGRVKVADFGLAKLLDHDAGPDTLTATGQVMGTANYMAPEQLEAPHTVDHRADIYSLGVVMYEMLTGELPMGRFPKPSQKVSIDVRLDEVVLRALEKAPDRRYQQASEVSSRIEEISSDSGPTPEPSGKSPSSFGWLTELAAAAPSVTVIGWSPTMTTAVVFLALVFTGVFLQPPAEILALLIVLGVVIAWAASAFSHLFLEYAALGTGAFLAGLFLFWPAPLTGFVEGLLGNPIEPETARLIRMLMIVPLVVCVTAFTSRWRQTRGRRPQPLVMEPGTTLFVEPMEADLDGSLKAEIVRQSLGLQVVADRASATWIMTGRVTLAPEQPWYESMFSEKDSLSAAIEVRDRRNHIVWAAEAGDYSPLGELSELHTPKRIVASRIVGQLRKSLAVGPRQSRRRHR